MSAITGANSVGSPLVLEIKGNALDDGPGIRTVVFLKGCPLSCTWCHNPESKRVHMELSFDPAKCIGCGECHAVCESGALTAGLQPGPDRELCSRCMACTEVCPSMALEQVGQEMDAGAVVAKVVKDHPFFEASGGGVTLSGGEPTLKPEYCGNLLRQFKDEGIHTLLETCGHFSWNAFESAILPWVDTVYCDIKLINPDAHKRHCGTTNTRILENLEKLLELSRLGDLDFLPRVPLIPGITATDENICAIGDYLKARGASRVQIMAYNPLWHGKSVKIGCDDLLAKDETMHKFMERDEVSRLTALFEARGLEMV
ncbi:pyruvate formate lyase-activating protein [Desulfoluna limicola]|uniref:Pyruvate formate lyase-activating protein n=1 Tax=Desulfoluna limicola TaxID=2810562 RepID=A0ABN6F216_9BACT|nr:glycyl-radical enzyme activating protein [Desulfoluna limicola]BCS95655.1 pyruvate formate lyase-activating protein [Desulfoluna limicola]